MSVLSPGWRRRVIDSLLFPIGYSLYTSRLIGLRVHSLRCTRPTHTHTYWGRMMSGTMAAIQQTPSGSSSSSSSGSGGGSDSKGSMPHSIVTQPIRVEGEGEGEDGSGNYLVRPIPMFDDNYAYLLLHPASRRAALVDPADPVPCMDVLKAEYGDYTLTHVLTTHKHWDHAGGNRYLASHLPSLSIVGGSKDDVDACNLSVSHGEEIDLAEGWKATALHSPCHTKGHICYKIGKAVYTGDTLFLGGCGRFFEGSGRDMYAALYDVLGSLPDSTLIFCGHEYSLANWQFGAFIEPNNAAIQRQLEDGEERRAARQPTIPGTLANERETNVFMRCHVKTVEERVRTLVGREKVNETNAQARAIQVMEQLRRLKNDNVHKKKK